MSSGSSACSRRRSCAATCSSRARLLVEVEVARRALLEPEPVVLRSLLQEVRRLLEHVIVLGGLRLLAGRVIAGHEVAMLVIPRLEVARLQMLAMLDRLRPQLVRFLPDPGLPPGLTV